MKNLDLINFILERQKILLRRKQNKPWPWSDDIVFNRTKINNIFRVEDKFTKYELKKISSTSSFVEKLKIILICRLILSEKTCDFIFTNKNLTVKMLKDFSNLVGGGFEYLNEVIQFYRPQGVSAEFRIIQHLEDVEKNSKLVSKKLLDSSTPAEAFKIIKDNFKILGDFRVYEVYTSLTYVKEFPHSENDFLFIGPGSLKLAESINCSSLKDFQQKALEIDKILKRKKLSFGNTFTVRSLEDSLCEFRKYKHGADIIAKNDYADQCKIYRPGFFPKILRYENPKKINKLEFNKIPNSKFWLCSLDKKDPIKLAAQIILPIRIIVLLKNLKDGEVYSKKTLHEIAESIFKTSSFVQTYFPTLVDLGIFTPFKKEHHGN